MQDPYVKDDDQNLTRFNQEGNFTQDMEKALDFADYVFICSAHKIVYRFNFEKIISGKNIQGVMDAANIYNRKQFEGKNAKICRHRTWYRLNLQMNLSNSSMRVSALSNMDWDGN